MLTYGVKENLLLVLTANENLNNKEEIEFLFSKKLKLQMVNEEFIKDIIEKVFLGEREDLFEIILNKANH